MSLLKKFVVYGIVFVFLLSSIPAKNIRTNVNGSVFAVYGDEGERVKDLE